VSWTNARTLASQLRDPYARERAHPAEQTTQQVVAERRTGRDMNRVLCSNEQVPQPADTGIASLGYYRRIEGISLSRKRNRQFDPVFPASLGNRSDCLVSARNIGTPRRHRWRRRNTRACHRWKPRILALLPRQLGDIERSPVRVAAAPSKRPSRDARGGQK